MRFARSLLFFGIALCSLATACAQINIFTITNGDVAGLKNALNTSNSDNKDDIINLATNGTYTLTAADNTTHGPTGLPVIAAENGHTVTISGHGSTITRSGSNLFRILQLSANAIASIDSLTVNNGSVSSTPGAGIAGGAGIYNNGGTLSLTSCTFSSNVAKGPNGANGVSAEPNGNPGEDGAGGAVLSTGPLTATNCTFTNNSAQGGNGGSGFGLNGIGADGGDGSGGAIAAGDGTTITGCAFTSNASSNGSGGSGNAGSGTPGVAGGGAIDGLGPASSVVRCTFDNNSSFGTVSSFPEFPGEGGAIYSAPLFGTGVGAVMQCTFTNNHADYGGAAFGVRLTGCLFSGNGANVGGGAIASLRGSNFFPGFSTSAINCTFYNNIAFQGGAAYSDGSNNTNSLTNCTLVHNSATNAGGSVYRNTVFENTIFRTGSPTNFSGGFVTSHGHNISDDAAEGDGSTGPGGDLNASGDMRNTSPQLLTSTPQNNGGPTQTFALIFNSPAINHGDDTQAPSRDQRGYARSGVSDIGAFEDNGRLTPLTAVSRKNHAGTDFDVDLPLNGTTAGVECRRNTSTDVSGPNAGHDHQVVVTFPYAVSLDDATADHAVTVDPLPSGNNMVYTVNLHNVPNAQLITISLNHVSDGTNSFTDTIPMGVLVGDTGGDRSVNSADVGQTKSKSGQTVDGSDFREDVNIDNSINSADISLVKSRSGTALP